MSLLLFTGVRNERPKRPPKPRPGYGQVLQFKGRLMDDWGEKEKAAYQHLVGAGFRRTMMGTWIKPREGYELAPEDCDAINHLKDIWGYGGLARPSDVPA